MEDTKKALRLVESYLRECAHAQYECECYADEEPEIHGSDDMNRGFSPEPESFEPYERMTPVEENFEMDEENPCEQGASYSPSKHGCFDNIKGTKAKLKPGYRLDPKKGFVKTSDDKTVGRNTTETEHWHGQGMTTAHAR